MDAFLKTLALTTMAEMGDKTQLLVLAWAARLRMRDVLLGVAIGALVTTGLAVGLGGAVLALIPRRWIKLGAGLLFLGFGLWTLRGGDEDEAEAQPKRGASAHPALGVAASFFLAELGDKTQLSAAVLAAESSALLAVWWGSALGLLLADAAAALVGRAVGRRLPRRAIAIGAAALFLVFGALLIAEALRLP